MHTLLYIWMLNHQKRPILLLTCKTREFLTVDLKPSTRGGQSGADISSGTRPVIFSPATRLLLFLPRRPHVVLWWITSWRLTRSRSYDEAWQFIFLDRPTFPSNCRLHFYSILYFPDLHFLWERLWSRCLQVSFPLLSIRRESMTAVLEALLHWRSFNVSVEIKKYPLLMDLSPYEWWPPRWSRSDPVGQTELQLNLQNARCHPIKQNQIQQGNTATNAHKNEMNWWKKMIKSVRQLVTCTVRELLC